MKIRCSFPLLAVLGLSLSACLAGTARAGSAVATDHHGGFGFSYGSRPERQLCREAIRRCIAKSRFPDEVEIVVSTASPGSGVIVRFRVDGEQHIYATVGADSPGEAHRSAVEGARDMGASRSEVVARWED